MNFNLTDLEVLIKLIQSVSFSVLPLLLSITIPLIFAAFRKLIPPTNTVIQIPLPDNNANDAKNNDIATTTNWSKFINWFKLPSIDNWVILLSICLFSLGCITIKIEQNKIDRYRHLGIRIKNYYYENNIYFQDIREIQKVLPQADSCTLAEISEYFFDEFVLTPPSFNTFDGNRSDTLAMSQPKFLYLVDGKISKEIVEFTVKLLDSYLSNPYILNNSGGYIFYYQLRQQNVAFTPRVIKQLVTTKYEKYLLTIQKDANDHDILKFGIAKTIPLSVKNNTTVQALAPTSTQ